MNRRQFFAFFGAVLAGSVFPPHQRTPASKRIPVEDLYRGGWPERTYQWDESRLWTVTNGQTFNDPWPRLQAHCHPINDPGHSHFFYANG